MDRTAKLYIGGKQARPDGGYSLTVRDAAGEAVGEVGEGNRKDIRNAVEAARAAAGGWARATAHNRAQVLYYVAENLEARADEFAARIARMAGGGEEPAAEEVRLSIERIYDYAAWADKYDGAVHHTPIRNVTLAMPEPLGVVGIACPDARPLLAFVSAVMPAVALGNAVVAIPSERWPLAATDLYQVFDTSDVPGGVINIVTGKRDALMETLAAHDDVEAVWYFGPQSGVETVERLSAGNMKRTWHRDGAALDWSGPGLTRELLRESVQVKNIWAPYGE